MILETIVTSTDQQGRVNVAPMGPRVDSFSGDLPNFVLRPFKSSRTYENLLATREAVIHFTDDVSLFSKAAVGALTDDDIQQCVEPIADTGLWRLKDCHRWFAISVDSIVDQELKVEMHCKVNDSQAVRPWFGFNRAKHAVIEAAILATRTHLLDADEIESELSRLQPLIDKTAGPVEHDAFEFLRKTIHERLANG